MMQASYDDLGGGNVFAAERLVAESSDDGAYHNGRVLFC